MIKVATGRFAETGKEAGKGMHCRSLVQHPGERPCRWCPARGRCLKSCFLLSLLKFVIDYWVVRAICVNQWLQGSRYACSVDSSLGEVCLAQDLKLALSVEFLAFSFKQINGMGVFLIIPFERKTWGCLIRSLVWNLTLSVVHESMETWLCWHRWRNSLFWMLLLHV